MAEAPWENDPITTAAPAAADPDDMPPPSLPTDTPPWASDAIDPTHPEHAPTNTPPWASDPIDPTHPQHAPTGPQDTSYLSALRYGASDDLHGLSSTFSKARALAPGFTDAVTGGLNSAADFVGPGPNYQPAGSTASEFDKGNYWAALKSIPRAAVESVPDLSATVAAGLLGDGEGAAAYQAARNLGPNADARAAANGHTQATGRDIAEALPGTALSSLAAVTGLGIIPGVKQAVSAVPTLVGRIGARMALEGAGAGAQSAITQAGNTLGTTQGLTVDPGQVAAAAVQGAGARGLQSG